MSISNDLRQAVLQAAIQGKLTKQLPEDGNAKDLLEQIKAEKAKLIKEGKLKKEKPLPEITEAEKPVDIPENWGWVRLGELFATSSGSTPQSNNPIYYKEGIINWVRTTDLNNGVLRSCEIQVTEQAVKDYNLKFIPRNSICLAMYGALVLLVSIV